MQEPTLADVLRERTAAAKLRKTKFFSDMDEENEKQKEEMKAHAQQLVSLYRRRMQVAAEYGESSLHISLNPSEYYREGEYHFYLVECMSKILERDGFAVTVSYDIAGSLYSMFKGDTTIVISWR